MKKFGVIIFLLGVGNIFADLTPVQLLDEVSVPDNTDSTILEVLSISEAKTGDEDIAKAAQENVEDGVVLKQNEVEETNEFENVKPIDDGNLSLDINIDAIQDGTVDVKDNNDLSEYYNVDDNYIPMTENDFRYKDLMRNDPNEIMETAAGFVPIPILKRRQKPRKQFANRRFFGRPRPYPYYRRFYFYPYYRYHYPSSLRFY